MAALAAVLSSGAAMAEAQPAAVATIGTETANGVLTLSGRVTALSDGRYEARMTIEKSGPAGRTSTTQGSAFTLASGQTATAATVGISMAPGDTLSVELVLEAYGREVARNRLSVGP